MKKWYSKLQEKLGLGDQSKNAVKDWQSSPVKRNESLEVAQFMATKPVAEDRSISCYDLSYTVGVTISSHVSSSKKIEISCFYFIILSLNIWSIKNVDAQFVK